MSPPSHTDGRLFTLHGGGPLWEDGARPSLPLHVERTPRRLLSAEQAATGSQPAASQRLQTGVKDWKKTI